MKRFFVPILTLVFLGFIYGLYLNRFSIQITDQSITSSHPEYFFDYKGVTHLPTDRSTGNTEFKQIISDAQYADLDFIILTELNDFQQSQSREAYYNRLLLLEGKKYSYLNSRVIVYRKQFNKAFQNSDSVNSHLADMLSRSEHEPKDGSFILAHPLKPGFKWHGEIPVGFDGVEVINLKRLWQEAWQRSKASFLWSLYAYPFNSELALLRLYKRPKQELEMWDKLNIKNFIAGYAGTEADTKIKFGPNKFFNVPSNKTLLNFFTNHVLLRSELTGHFENDKAKILQALHRGQFYMSLDLISNPKGFNFYAKSKNDVYTMGEKISLKHKPVLKVVLSQKPKVPYEVIIYRNGVRVLTSNSLNTELYLHLKGSYRAEVRVAPTLPLPDGKNWITWIYTNPLHVID
ncbi:MAG: hypothetical protein MK008_02025 [Bdellovibrionales bacterium]|nr:hypothetical protein [Bdellovibrionales bacterium]